MTHRVLLLEVVIDVPSHMLVQAHRFWSAALLTGSPVPDVYPAYGRLGNAASLAQVGLQDIGRDAARIHLDFETDDVNAEVARLSALGAVERACHPSWVVMADPAGILFCVSPASSAEFDQRAREVPD